MHCRRPPAHRVGGHVARKIHRSALTGAYIAVAGELPPPQQRVFAKRRVSVRRLPLRERIHRSELKNKRKPACKVAMVNGMKIAVKQCIE